MCQKNLIKLGNKKSPTRNIKSIKWMKYVQDKKDYNLQAENNGDLFI